MMAWLRIGDKPFIWSNSDPIHWRIYAALGGDELMSYALMVIAIDTTNNAFKRKKHEKLPPDI